GSVGAELYPDFNVFDVARPYARALVFERYRPTRLARRSRQEAANYAHILQQMPYQLHDTLEQVRDGQVEIGFRHEGLDPMLRRLDVVANRFVIAIVGAGGVIGSALIGTFASGGPQL